MRDPLLPLIVALYKRTTPPFEWIVEWAGDGTLDAAWAASRNGSFMIEVFAFAKTPADLARATVRCLRALAPDDALHGADRQQYERAVAAVDGWISGRVSRDDLRRIRDDVGAWRGIVDTVLKEEPAARAVAASEALLLAVDPNATEDIEDSMGRWNAAIADVIRPRVAPPPLARLLP